MRVLLTNDDGIQSEGIRALRSEFTRNSASCLTVAPSREQSGTGASITLHHPLRVHKIAAREYAVDGTPADCVKAGVVLLSKKRPDVVVTGINPGCNLGVNLLSSGTVSAAMEAYSLGIPAVAVSIIAGKNLHYDYAAALAYKLAKACLAAKRVLLLNVNIPDIAPEKIKGIRLTSVGRARFAETFRRRKDPRGNVYYWLDGQIEDAVPDPRSDYRAVKDGYVSVTPLRLDLTDESALPLCGDILNSLR